jgi:uncharacterized membrane protein
VSKKNKIKRKIGKPGTTAAVVTPVSSSTGKQSVQKKFPFIDFILRPHIVFTILSFLFGSLFIVTTPPFQVADEIAHFKRAFKLAELGTIQKIKNNQSGDDVPVSIDSTLSLFRYLMYHSEQKVDKQKILDAFKIPLQPRKRKFTNIDAGPYFYLSYIPQFPAVYLGKLLGLNVLVILYLGRFFALIFYIVCVRYAIKTIPVAKFLLMTIALMPMCLAQAGSYNADCVLFSLSFLAMAILLKLSFDRQKLEMNKETILLFFILVIIGLLKIVYLPIAFFVFILPKILFKNNLRYYIITAFIILLSATLTIAWFKMNSLSTTPPDPGLNTAGKIKLLLQNPFVSLKILSESIDRFYETYYRTTIGVLGYIDTILKDGVYKAFAFLIVLLALFEGGKNHKLFLYQRIIFFIVSVSVFAAIFTAMYLINPKENGFIATGVQGRYFIPILFPFFMAFHGLIPIRFNLSNYRILVSLLFLILFFALFSTQMTILERYYTG